MSSMAGDGTKAEMVAGKAGIKVPLLFHHRLSLFLQAFVVQLI